MTAGILINSNLIIDVFAAGEAVDVSDATALDNFTHTLDASAGTVTLTKYNGSATTVKVAPTYTVDGVEYITVIDSTTTFRENKKITSVTICPGVKFANNTTQYLFYSCSALTSAYLAGADTSGVTDMQYMFSKCSKITTIDVTGIDTSSVITMYATFDQCTNLANLIGYEYWDTSSLENMFWMFNKITKLVTIDLSRWDLSQVNNSAWCFQSNAVQYLYLPDNLKTISAGFLNHASSVKGSTFTIPAGVEKIGYAHTIYDFGTNDFVEFIVPEENKNYVAVDGILYSADMKELLAVPRAKTFENNTFYVPEGVEFFGELSFSRNYNINTLVLPDSYEIVPYVEKFNPRYIIYEDIGNLNASNSVAIAVYVLSGITSYAVKPSNPRYTSRNGIIYSKDMSTLLCIPTRYNQFLNIPEGVTTWVSEALWSVQDTYMSNSTGVYIPASMRYIAPDQIAKLNHYNKKYSTFNISVHPDNPVYTQDASGNIVATGAVVWNESSKKVYTSLSDAMTEVIDGDVLTLLSDIVLSEDVTVPADITLRGDYTITREPGSAADTEGGTSVPAYLGTLINVAEGATLTLDGGITVDGGHEWIFEEEKFLQAQAEFQQDISKNYNANTFITFIDGAPVATTDMISVRGGLVLNNATIQNHVGTVNGTAIRLHGGATLEMNDGAVMQHNHTKTSDFNAASCVKMADNTEFVINGGEIRDNFGYGTGDCILNNGGVITMNGGKLHSNHAVGGNGSVMVMYQNDALLIMNGGEICYNTSVRSGNGHSSVIYLHSSGSVIMNGGSIHHNMGVSGGGIMMNNNAGTVTVTGGSLIENECQFPKDHEKYADYSKVADLNGPPGSVFISGGVFTSEIGNHFVDGYGVAIDLDVVDGLRGVREYVYYTPSKELVRLESNGQTYPTVDAALADAVEGDTLTLLHDQRIAVDLSEAATTEITTDVTIDMDGYTLYGWGEDNSLFRVSSDVTVTGEGKIDTSKFSDSKAFVVGSADGTEAGNLTLENGTYLADVSIVTVEKGVLAIEDGYYEAQPDSEGNYQYTLDCVDESFADGSASIILTGGTYSKFDPEYCRAEGSGTNFCESEHKSLDNMNDTWKVVPKIPVYVCRNVQTGVLYESVMLGLNTAEAGQTVELITSTSDGDLIIFPSISLDLNGFTLTANNIIAAGSTARLYDSTNCAANGYRPGGLLKIKGSMVLSETNEQAVPVFVPEKGGFIFVDFLFNSAIGHQSDYSRVNLLVTSRTMEVISLFLDGASDNNIQIVIRITVDGQETKNFVFTETTIKNVMQSNQGKFNLFERMFFANFTGFDEFESITAQAMVIANDNVIDFGGSALILK